MDKENVEYQLAKIHEFPEVLFKLNKFELFDLCNYLYWILDKACMDLLDPTFEKRYQELYTSSSTRVGPADYYQQYLSIDPKPDRTPSFNLKHPLFDFYLELLPKAKRLLDELKKPKDIPASITEIHSFLKSYLIDHPDIISIKRSNGKFIVKSLMAACKSEFKDRIVVGPRQLRRYVNDYLAKRN